MSIQVKAEDIGLPDVFLFESKLKRSNRIIIYIYIYVDLL